MQWSPLSKNDVEALISTQLQECSVDEQTLFEKCRTPLRAASINRSGKEERVFIVAVHADLAVYYEDVEEGFNLSPLHANGSIAEPGFNQWSLGEALGNLMSR